MNCYICDQELQPDNFDQWKIDSRSLRYFQCYQFHGIFGVVLPDYEITYYYFPVSIQQQGYLIEGYYGYTRLHKQYQEIIHLPYYLPLDYHFSLKQQVDNFTTKFANLLMML